MQRLGEAGILECMCSVRLCPQGGSEDIPQAQRSSEVPPSPDQINERCCYRTVLPENNGADRILKWKR
jgi:hypothetical protein